MSKTSYLKIITQTIENKGESDHCFLKLIHTKISLIYTVLKIQSVLKRASGKTSDLDRLSLTYFKFSSGHALFMFWRTWGFMGRCLILKESCIHLLSSLNYDLFGNYNWTRGPWTLTVTSCPGKLYLIIIRPIINE